MKRKNSLAVAGLVLAFANLGSVKAQAGQSYASTQCEPFKIVISVPYSGFESPAQTREKLNLEAYAKCSGHKFIINVASIQPYSRQVRQNFNPEPRFVQGIKAEVSCLNSY